MNWETIFSSLAAEWSGERAYQNPFDSLSRTWPVTRHGQKGVMVFPSIGGENLFRLHQELNQKVPTLALLSTVAQLEAAPALGNKVLYCPEYPEVALAALKSASWVVSFDKFVTHLCQRFGIACLDLTETEKENGLWEKIQALSSKTANQKQNRLVKSAPHFAISAVADSNFIGFFFGLMENLRQVSEVPWHTYLLALDEKARDLAKAQYPDMPMTIWLASELWTPQEWEDYKNKPIADKAYASKPRSVLNAVKDLKNKGNIPLYFCDVDLHFTESPEHLGLQAFGKHQALLMPQWSDVFAWARFHGMFNSGFMGVLPGAEPFLQWWADMCVPFCRMDKEKGYFGDQVFLDMALWHFPQIGVYREMDHNVAPWNRKTLGVYRPGKASGELRLRDGRKVKSFHAAGPDSDGYFQLKFAWDQIASFFSVIPDPDKMPPLFRNTVDQQLVYASHLKEALELRQNWKRRLRFKARDSFTPVKLRKILTPTGKTLTACLKRADAVVSFLRKLVNKKPPQDGFSRDEQKLLVGIQQRFAFDLNRLQVSKTA